MRNDRAENFDVASPPRFTASRHFTNRALHHTATTTSYRMTNSTEVTETPAAAEAEEAVPKVGLNSPAVFAALCSPPSRQLMPDNPTLSMSGTQGYTLHDSRPPG